MSQITILNQANVPMGPFTREEVTGKLQTGEFTLSSLAYIEGLSQWTPLRDVLARIDAAATPISGRPPAPVSATAAYSYAATMQPPSHLVYAGFWLRFCAYFIDSLILGGVVFLVCMIFGIFLGPIAAVLDAGHHANESADNSAGQVVLGLGIALVEMVVAVVLIAATWLYFALQESGTHQATFGKRAMGLRVTTLAGERIGFGRASGRFFAKIISKLILYIGFIMAGFTERKQALHDMLAGTLVVRN